MRQGSSQEHCLGRVSPDAQHPEIKVIPLRSLQKPIRAAGTFSCLPPNRVHTTTFTLSSYSSKHLWSSFWCTRRNSRIYTRAGRRGHKCKPVHSWVHPSLQRWRVDAWHWPSTKISFPASTWSLPETIHILRNVMVWRQRIHSQFQHTSFHHAK